MWGFLHSKEGVCGGVEEEAVGGLQMWRGGASAVGDGEAKHAPCWWPWVSSEGGGLDGGRLVY